MIEQTTAASGGANPVRVKAYNERLALTLLRRHGELAKADISRLSGLSAQAMTVLIRGLEADQLVLRGEPRRGKVGQPSVPYRIDPDGAFSVGVKIGRRSADVVLVDFLGNVRAEQSVTYRWPDPKRLLRFATEATQSVIATLTAEQRTRVVGAGVAMPFRIWEWPRSTPDAPATPRPSARWSSPTTTAAPHSSCTMHQCCLSSKHSPSRRCLPG